MREIKFRAWDKTDKIMLQPYSGCISDGKVFMSCKSGNEFELMQYTGLKDKNDKEIYEGDIVKFPLFDNNEVICYLHREVIFHNGMFKIKPIKEGNYGMPREEDEVIGNIHQNPEVLTHSETKVNKNEM